MSAKEISKDACIFQKTRLCKFYIRGQCTRGMECTFAHGKEQLLPSPDFFKTRLCSEFFRTGVCSGGQDCRFAHNHLELRPLRVGAVPQGAMPLRPGRTPSGSAAAALASSASSCPLMPPAPSARGPVLPGQEATSEALYQQLATFHQLAQMQHASIAATGDSAEDEDLRAALCKQLQFMQEQARRLQAELQAMQAFADAPPVDWPLGGGGGAACPAGRSATPPPQPSPSPQRPPQPRAPPQTSPPQPQASQLRTQGQAPPKPRGSERARPFEGPAARQVAAPAWLASEREIFVAGPPWPPQGQPQQVEVPAWAPSPSSSGARPPHLEPRAAQELVTGQSPPSMGSKVGGSEPSKRGLPLPTDWSRQTTRAPDEAGEHVEVADGDDEDEGEEEQAVSGSDEDEEELGFGPVTTSPSMGAVGTFGLGLRGGAGGCFSRQTTQDSCGSSDSFVQTGPAHFLHEPTGLAFSVRRTFLSFEDDRAERRLPRVNSADGALDQIGHD